MTKFLGFLVAIALMAISATPPAAIAATSAINQEIAEAAVKLGQWEAITQTFLATPWPKRVCSVKKEVLVGMEIFESGLINLEEGVTTEEEADKVTDMENRLQSARNAVDHTTCMEGGKIQEDNSI